MRANEAKGDNTLEATFQEFKSCTAIVYPIHLLESKQVKGGEQPCFPR